jgi:hypothetical protein
MSWLGKILFPKATRHDRHVKMLNLKLAASLVVIAAIVGVLFYFSMRRGH